jgi:hypothetical protein
MMNNNDYFNASTFLNALRQRLYCGQYIAP